MASSIIHDDEMMMMSRLDFFLVSDDIQSEVKSCEFLFPLSSDHSPVKLKIQTQEVGGTGNVTTHFSKTSSFFFRYEE